MNLANYVLGKISNENKSKMENLFDSTNEILEQFVMFKDVEKIHLKW